MVRGFRGEEREEKGKLEQDEETGSRRKRKKRKIWEYEVKDMGKKEGKDRAKNNEMRLKTTNHDDGSRSG